MVIKRGFSLPNLLAHCPFEWRENPHYVTSAPESVAWLKKYFQGSDLQKRLAARADILTNYTQPYADGRSFVLCADYSNLLFALDDVCDVRNGAEVRQVQELYLMALHGDPCDDGVISRMTIDFMYRHSKRCSPALMDRFLRHNREYASSVIREAELREEGRVLGLEEYQELRRNNSGVILSFDQIEVSLGFDLPDGVFEDAAFRKIYFSALDLVNYSNDMLSYKVERDQGLDGCNVLTVLMHENGPTLQEAVDYT